MVNQKSKEFLYFKVPVFVADYLLHCATILLLLIILPAQTVGIFNIDGTLTITHPAVGLLALLLFSFSISIAMYGLRLHERRIRPIYVIWRAAEQSGVTYILLVVALVILYKEVPRILLMWGFLISTPLIMVCHFIANLSVRWIRKAGHNTRHVVMVGADVTAQRMWKELQMGRSFTGYKIEGFFSSLPDVKLPEGAELLGSMDDFWSWIEEHNVDELYCSLPPASCQEEVNRIIHICNDKFIDFYFVPTFDGYPKRHLVVHRIGNVNYIKLREEPLNNPFAKALKRSADVFISGLFLCTLYPFVVLFVWIGNKVTGNVGPLYFRQARTGYNGQSFQIYKFRSMKVNAQADILQATENDPRKTPFGDFLRRSSIDELPQFINVFKGDMSIIGPRPHMEHHTEVYSSLVKDYMVRHLAKPGITGWAQVSGCRGETKTVEEMADRVAHDIWYIEHWSPSLDIEIFLKTIWQVLPGHDKQAY